MKAILLLLLSGSVAFGMTQGELAVYARQLARERAEAAVSEPEYTSGTKIMTFSATGYDLIRVEVPRYIAAGTRFVIRMPDGERVTGTLY